MLEPLIHVLRMIYTPAHAHYYLIHISQHLPKIEVEKLQFFAQISTLKDIEDRIPLAEVWFSELVEKLKELGME